VNQGMPPVVWDDPPPSAKALIELARSVCEPDVAAMDAQKEGRAGLLGRLRRA
jgi:hypothetical protein